MKNLASEIVAPSFQMLALDSENQFASPLGPEQTCCTPYGSNFTLKYQIQLKAI
jgi:hypothetical protein